MVSVIAVGAWLTGPGSGVAGAVSPGNSDGLAQQALAPPGGTARGRGSGGVEGGVGGSGDFTYAFDFEVPPGRNGERPQLGLRYSSASPVRGGVAAGWDLPVPAVTVDPEAGTVRPEWPTGGSAAAPRNFRGLNGRPLVPDPLMPVITGAVGFRELGDASYARYQYTGAVSGESTWWRVLTTDGATLRFGLKAVHPYSWAPLVSRTDGDGHELRYSYEATDRYGNVPAAGHPRDIVLTSVLYVAPGQADGYARVLLTLSAPARCGPGDLPTGSRLDYRYGYGRLSGSRKLTTVTTQTKATALASWKTARQYSLKYSAATENCAAPAAAAVTPFRELASVESLAWAAGGTTTAVPPVTFTYGKAGSYITAAHYETSVVVPGLEQERSVMTRTGSQSGPNNGYLFASTAPFRTTGTKFGAVPGNGGSMPADREDMPLAWLLSQGQAEGESVSRLLVDVTGDGRPDLLKTRDPDLATRSNAPATGGCKVEVWVNKRVDGVEKFEKDPTVFGGFSLTDAMADVPVTTTDADGAGELLCSLSRSLSATSSGWRGNAAVPCAAEQEAGEQWGAPASWGSMQQVRHGFVDLTGDGLPDIASQPIASIHCPYASTQNVPPPQGTTDADPYWEVEYRSAGTLGAPQKVLTKRQRYWYVYANTGSGFATDPQIVPVPSVADGGGGTQQPHVPQHVFAGRYWGNNLPGPANSGTFSDLTGDGVPDWAVTDRGTDTGKVFAGRPGGLLAPVSLAPGDAELGTRQPWTPDPNDIQGDKAEAWAESGTGIDVNGDGLPDRFVVNEAYTGTYVQLNDGYGFGTSADGGRQLFSNNHEDTKFLRWHREVTTHRSFQTLRESGDIHERMRMVDLDYDGLPDALSQNAAADAAKLHLSSGTTWMRQLPADAEIGRALAGWLRLGGLADSYADRGDYRYGYRHRAADLNGDGLLDLIDTAGGQVHVRYAKAELDKSENHRAPARLLRTITNNSGAKTVVTYARDTAVGAWTVSKVQVHPGQGEPAISTEYAFVEPVATPDPYGVHRFRGYAEQRVLRPGRATGEDDLTEVDTYRFDQDPLGALARSVKVRGTAAFTAAGRFDDATTPGVLQVQVHTQQVHTLNSWAPGMSVLYPSTVTLPRATHRYSCAGTTGQTAAACVNGASALTSETTWTEKRSGAALVAMVPTRVEQRFASAGTLHVRRADSTYHAHSAALALVIAPASVTHTGLIDGRAETLGGRTYAYHDAQFRKLHTITTTDPRPDGAGTGTTRFTYYPAGGAQQGLVKRIWAPEQVARHGMADNAAGYTEYSYDPAGAFLTQVINPRGHVVSTAVDRGTGAAVATEGPNYVCPDGPDQGNSPDPPSRCDYWSAAFRERTETKVDGLGRTTEHRRFPASDGPGVLVARYTYNDLAHYNAPGTPVSTVVELPAGDGELSHLLTEHDGLGRVTRTVTQQDPHPDATVHYDYDETGSLLQTRTPRADTGQGEVVMTVAYDALGRIVQTREVAPKPRVLTQITYDGLTVAASEVAAGTIPASKTVAVSDPAGQLITVRERTGFAGSTDVFATTEYRYDAAGNTVQVDAPDGVSTSMTHDYLGRRTSSTTAGRTWRYGFDRNGNLTSTREPLPTAGTDPAAYTHRVEYDDLNRPTAVHPAPRGLDGPERDRLKIGPTRLYYDGHDAELCAELPASAGCDANQAHQLGQLSISRSPVATVVNRYDDHGRPVSARQSLTALTGIVASDPIEAGFGYDPTGTLESQYHQALSSATGGSVTWEGATVQTEYARDGAAIRLRTLLGGKDMTIAHGRNAAGVVTDRQINTQGTIGFARPNILFKHDEYGRPTEVTAMMGSIQRYRQTLAYDAAGLVDLTTEQLGDITKPVTSTSFDYDHRDQLLTAATATSGGGPAPYYSGTFAYTPGGRVQSASVLTTGTARDVTRNATHRYQDPTQPGGDPQRLRALTKPDGSSLTGDYDYDAAGNLLKRYLPTGDGSTVAVTQTWDGPHLRQVEHPSGEKEVYFYDGSTRVAAVRYTASGAVAEARRWFGPVEVDHKPATGAGYRHTLTLGGDTIGRIDGDASTGTIEHYLTGPQGHQVLALNHAGSTVRVASYGPYGELLTQATATGTPAGKYTEEFNGKTYDPTSGLHYYGFRHYDSYALQWASSDPLFRSAPDRQPTRPRSANLYTFTDNNPVNGNDPDGLCPECTGDAGESVDWTWGDHGPHSWPAPPEPASPLGAMLNRADEVRRSWENNEWLPESADPGLVLDPGWRKAFEDPSYQRVVMVLDQLEIDQMKRAESSHRADAKPSVRVTRPPRQPVRVHVNPVWTNYSSRGNHPTGNPPDGTPATPATTRTGADPAQPNATPPRVGRSGPEWDKAQEIAAGHAWDRHFEVPDGRLAFNNRQELAEAIHTAMTQGKSKRLERGRKAYWYGPKRLVVIVNPNDPDGGTAFESTWDYYQRLR